MLVKVKIEDMKQEYLGMCRILSQAYSDIKDRNVLDPRLTKLSRVFQKYKMLFEMCDDLQRRKTYDR